MESSSKALARIAPQVGTQLIPILASIAILTVGSKLYVPWIPVPFTLQTLAVMLVGAFLGSKRGLVALLSYEALAFCGAPILASEKAGPLVFIGPTAGYLFSWLAVVSLYARSGDGQNTSYIAKLGWLLAGSAITLAIGTIWLANFVGVDKAFGLGFAPFILPEILKSVVACGLITGIASRKEAHK